MSAVWWRKLKGFFAQLDEDFAEEERRRPAQKWNDLLIHIAREIEQVMLAEMLEPPGEPVYIPPEYIVFLSPADDAGLQGDRRVGFLRGLRNITAERAHRVVGSGRAQTEKIAVELRVDSSLEEDQFYVKASWDVKQDQTTLLAEPPLLGWKTPDEDARLVDDELTVIHPRPLFAIQVMRQGGSEPLLHHLFKSEVRIGRGGRDVPVDVLLPEDREVSRLHAILRQTPDGFEICMKGKNPMWVAGHQLRPGETVMVHQGDSIQIGIYTLHVTPAASGGKLDEGQERDESRQGRQ